MTKRVLTCSARFIIVTLYLSLAVVQPVLAEPMTVPGTSVAMDPPEGFTLASAFTGFENLATQSSITITELPAEAYAELESIFTELDSANQAFAAQNIEITDISTVVVDGDEVALLQGSQSIQSRKITKYFVVLESDATVLVSFNVFDDESTTRDKAVAAVESIKIGAVATLEQKIENLGFTFEAKEPFKTKDVLGGSAALLATFEGTDPTGDKPLIIIGSSLQQVDVSDIENLSVALLSGTKGFEQAEFDNGQSVSLPGGTAYVQEGKSGTPLAIQYLWVASGSQYVRLVAAGASDQVGPLRETIQAIAKSVMPIE